MMELEFSAVNNVRELFAEMSNARVQECPVVVTGVQMNGLRNLLSNNNFSGVEANGVADLLGLLTY